METMISLVLGIACGVGKILMCLLYVTMRTTVEIERKQREMRPLCQSCVGKKLFFIYF